MKHRLRVRIPVFVAVGGVLLGGALLLAWNPEVIGLKGAKDGPALAEFAPMVVTSQGRPERILSVAKYEVTNAQWDECVDRGGCSHAPKTWPYTRPDHPVSGVSWSDVQQYLTWVSGETGKRFRLPTESEWRQFAAGVLAKQDAGKKLFDDPRMEWANEYRFFARRAPRQTQPIGHYGVSPAGIADLDGNVREWTASCWNSQDKSKPDAIAERCKVWRVLAGTHVTYVPEFIRYVPVGGCSIGYPPANIGFRIVLDEPLTDAG